MVHRRLAQCKITNNVPRGLVAQHRLFQPRAKKKNSGIIRALQVKPICVKQHSPLDREQLAAYPLYITIDKDCLKKEVCKQNWNAGDMTLEDVRPT